LIAHESKACSEFKQQLRDILYKLVLDLFLVHSLAVLNEVEHIWVFHRLFSEFALRQFKPLTEIADFVRQRLSIVKLILGLFG
jgi:hypothetical protein